MSETLRISNRDDIDWTTTSNIQYSASGVLHEEPTPLVPAWMDWGENWQLICNTTLIESQQTNRCHREGSPQDLKSCPCKQPDGRGKADVVSAPERIDLPKEAFLSSVKFRGVNSGASPNSAEEFQFSTAKWRTCGFEGFPPPPTIVDALSECGEWLPVDAGAAALQIPQWARPLGCLLRNLLKWSNFPDRAR
jgi:hypothetical protein